MPYFHVSSGMRGCYMPDAARVVRVETRRELRDLIQSEVDFLDYPFGGSKVDVARVAATVWRDMRARRPAYLPFVVPLGDRRGSRPFGVFVSHATRRDYLEFLETEEA